MLSALAILTSAPALLWPGELADLEAIERKILKEPVYVSPKPLYCLVVFGPSAEVTMWLVLDSTESTSDGYDVLYADLDGNGDLTDAGERFEAASGGQRPLGAGRTEFRLPDITDLTAAGPHTEFGVATDATQMIRLRWRGERRMGGGYPVDPENGYMRFGESAEEAPVLWFNGDGPLQFQHWMSGRLRIGGQTDFKGFLGMNGIGESSFCAFQEHVLDEGAGARATLVYTNTAGEENELVFALDNKC
jgi:hypothetical protein